MSSRGESFYCDICCMPQEFVCVGHCDHPVCLECSMRMRILCESRECPSCRQQIDLVVTTSARFADRPFGDFVLTRMIADEPELCKRFGYRFDTNRALDYALWVLSFECMVDDRCNQRQFRDFGQLRDHVKRYHKLDFCDICLSELKLFPFEMKCYDKSGLKEHMQVGDADDRSHRGHPLCEFCRQRYLDSDKLFFHLRKDHFFCHICDAAGAAATFYDHYENLREHYVEAHFLCEEGNCKREQFTNVFSNEIDFKAHKTNTHGRDMTREQRRQERTIAIEFDYGPTRAEQMRNMRRTDRGRWTGESHEVMESGRGARYYGGRRRRDEERRGPQAPERNRPQPDDSSLLSAREGAYPVTSAPAGAPTMSSKPEPSVEFKVENPEAEFPHLVVGAVSSAASAGAGMRRSASQKQVAPSSTWLRTGSLGEDDFPTLDGPKGRDSGPSPLASVLAQSTKPKPKQNPPKKAQQPSKVQGSSNQAPVKKGLTMMDLNDFPILPGMEVEASLGPRQSEALLAEGEEPRDDGDGVRVAIAGVENADSRSPSPPSITAATRADVAGKSFLEILGVNRNQQVGAKWQEKGRRVENLTASDFPGLPVPAKKTVIAGGSRSAKGAWGTKSEIGPSQPRQSKVAPMPEPIDFGVATFTKPKHKKMKPVESKQKKQNVEKTTNKKQQSGSGIDPWDADDNTENVEVVASTSSPRSAETKKQSSVSVKEHKGDESEFYDPFPALPATASAKPRQTLKTGVTAANDQISNMRKIEPPSSWDYLEDVERRSDEECSKLNSEQVVPAAEDFPGLPSSERPKYNFDRKKKKAKRAKETEISAEPANPDPVLAGNQLSDLKSLGDSLLVPDSKPRAIRKSETTAETVSAESQLQRVPNGDVDMEPPPGLLPPPGLGCPRPPPSSELTNGDMSLMQPPGLGRPRSFEQNNNLTSTAPPGLGPSQGVAPLRPLNPRFRVPPPGLAPNQGSGARPPFYVPGVRFRADSQRVVRKDKKAGYVRPEGYTRRRNRLHELVEKDIGDGEGYAEFKMISGAFHKGAMSANEYWNRLQPLLTPEGFEQIFPELIALLPNIQQQHALRDADFSKHTKTLHACDTCYQLLVDSDLIEHRKGHHGNP